MRWCIDNMLMTTVLMCDMLDVGVLACETCWYFNVSMCWCVDSLRCWCVDMFISTIQVRDLNYEKRLSDRYWIRYFLPNTLVVRCQQPKESDWSGQSFTSNRCGDWNVYNQSVSHRILQFEIWRNSFTWWNWRYPSQSLDGIVWFCFASLQKSTVSVSAT